MRRVFTITGNLLAETESAFDMPERGQTARAVGGSTFRVGGKGVNVARTAIALGMGATAAIFPAGYNGRRCVDVLCGENIPLIASELDGETRSGLVCVDVESGAQTTFLGSNLPVPESALDDVLARISQAANAGDILAFCGSFPAWKPNYAEKIADLARGKKLLLCIDTYGEPLADFTGTDCDIVKINRAELFALLGKSDDGTERDFAETFETARAEFFENAKIFAASDGANPILSDFGRGTEKIAVPKIDGKVRATGCGDAMLARLIYEIFEKHAPAKTALKRAAAYASLCAECSGVGKIDPEKREREKRISLIV